MDAARRLLYTPPLLRRIPPLTNRFDAAATVRTGTCRRRPAGRPSVVPSQTPTYSIDSHAPATASSRHEGRNRQGPETAGKDTKSNAQKQASARRPHLSPFSFTDRAEARFTPDTTRSPDRIPSGAPQFRTPLRIPASGGTGTNNDVYIWPGPRLSLYLPQNNIHERSATPPLAGTRKQISVA